MKGLRSPREVSVSKVGQNIKRVQNIKPMKINYLSALLVISSLIGYLEWGKTNHAFFFQVEYTILVKVFINPISVLHPLIIVPVASQILLLFTIFQKKPSKVIIYICIGGLAALFLFVFSLGLISANYRIMASTLPFIGVSILTIKQFRKI